MFKFMHYQLKDVAAGSRRLKGGDDGGLWDIGDCAEKFAEFSSPLTVMIELTAVAFGEQHIFECMRHTKDAVSTLIITFFFVIIVVVLLLVLAREHEPAA